jgi:hypothetical protein
MTGSSAGAAPDGPSLAAASWREESTFVLCFFDLDPLGAFPRPRVLCAGGYSQIKFRLLQFAHGFPPLHPIFRSGKPLQREHEHLAIATFEIANTLTFAKVTSQWGLLAPALQGFRLDVRRLIT